MEELLDRAFSLVQAGDTTGALAAYRDAMAAGPDDAIPVLKTAELHLYSLDEPDEALALARRASDLAADDDDAAEAALISAEAELALDREDDAREALALLADLHVQDPSVHCRAGEILLDLGELDRAEQHYRAAISGDPELADAHHGLGSVCEARGDMPGARQAWLTTRKLDVSAPHAPWAISEDEFERVAEHAFDRLPKDVRTRLVNVPILVSDYPSVEIVADGNDPRMLGFFTGVPMGEKENVGASPTGPDCIFLYQRNIENACAGPDDLEREIAITLWHETAHFFGLDDDDLVPLGLA